MNDRRRLSRDGFASHARISMQLLIESSPRIRFSYYDDKRSDSTEMYAAYVRNSREYLRSLVLGHHTRKNSRDETYRERIL